PVAATIEGFAQVLADPGIEQHVARSAVEASHWLVRFDQAEVAEAADVEHGPGLIVALEEGFVEGRYQWRALAPRGDVSAPEVGDHIDSGQLRQQRGVAD